MRVLQEQYVSSTDVFSEARGLLSSWLSPNLSTAQTTNKYRTIFCTFESKQYNPLTPRHQQKASFPYMNAILF